MPWDYYQHVIATLIRLLSIWSTTLAAENVDRIILQDVLQASTLGTRYGGHFVAGGGWQTTSTEDMLVYDLGRYLENGALTVRVRNFKPSAQNAFERHHVIGMFRNPWGNHQSAENLETLWSFHTGYNFSPGIKLLSYTDIRHEHQTTIRDDWDREATYEIKVTWQGRRLRYYRNGALILEHTHEGPMQLRYLFLGRDRTVSGDYITNFHHNQYFAPLGPIYSDLTVIEQQPASDNTPSQIQNTRVVNRYANAARLQWATNEAAVCYVEYGTTTAYGARTPVLGPPAQIFSTTLAKLAPNQTYHYRIVARDDADHLTVSTDFTFTTLAGELYLFHPSADAFVERAGHWGETRDRGNYGFVHLAMGASWKSYLRFEVAQVEGKVAHATLRLYGRQSGRLNGAAHALASPWDEMEVTWLTQPQVSARQLARLEEVKAGRWHPLVVEDYVKGNGVYDFAVLGTSVGSVSFASRECENFQPELVLTARSQNPR
ncbi:MAG: DNRLRE domain-containing protein [candidate division KSB1 bacterium]